LSPAQAIEFSGALPQDGIVSGRKGPQGRKKAMKKTFITIAFAAASLPMFAAQATPATPATPPQKAPVTESKPAVKGKAHKKAVKKSVEKSEKKASPAAAKPASK
jgi:hypothetical protein